MLSHCESIAFILSFAHLCFLPVPYVSYHSKRIVVFLNKNNSLQENVTAQHYVMLCLTKKCRAHGQLLVIPEKNNQCNQCNPQS